MIFLNQTMICPIIISRERIVLLTVGIFFSAPFAPFLSHIIYSFIDFLRSSFLSSHVNWISNSQLETGSDGSIIMWHSLEWPVLVLVLQWAEDGIIRTSCMGTRRLPFRMSWREDRQKESCSKYQLVSTEYHPVADSHFVTRKVVLKSLDTRWSSGWCSCLIMLFSHSFLPSNFLIIIWHQILLPFFPFLLYVH